MANWKELMRRLERPVLTLAAAASLAAVLMSLEFNLLEANLYDYRMSASSQPRPDPGIALITLDDATVRELDEFAPLPLEHHARFLESLAGLEPRGVGFLLDLNQINQVNPEQFRTEWGDRFVTAAGRLESRGIPVVLGTSFDVTGEVVPPYPLSTLPHSIAVIHKDGNVFSEDKITRRALARLSDRPAFHLELARRLGHLAPGQEPRGTFDVPEIDARYFFFRYHGSTALPPAPRGETAPLPYPSVSYIEVLRGTDRAREALRGRIALVGSLIREDSSDYAFTPYSRRPFANPKLVVHANILNTVLHDDAVVRVPSAVNWGVTFFLTAFVFAWVLNSSPLKSLFASLTAALAAVLVGQLLFNQGYWLRLSQPLVGIFLGYYLVVPYRLILEYKRRWDYQRKHELLVQVEELKTNFLSLVTHDLKTPVARIQGLAEVLKRKAAERLVDRDRETINHILAATDELNRFISSILELNRVESNRLTLNLESRDLNQLVERAVEGFKAQARASRIELAVDLEPLFPIRFDPALVSKVLNNLIDNALKYSPPQSTIRIVTREIEQWVELTVADEGIGLSAGEIEQLFTRFYRAKNDTTTKVAGTGLGLYLTKYFIEAHRGEVHVESEPGRGSRFRIRLPLQATVDADASREVAAPTGLRRLLKPVSLIHRFRTPKKETLHA
jgi:signal transduction histidine kinase